MKKCIVLVMIMVLSLVVGCVDEVKESDGSMTLEEAIAVAQESDCMTKGGLTEKYMYNENSKTWWIDLEMKEEFAKDYCSPACVVSEETKTAEINWRCTGLLA